MRFQFKTSYNQDIRLFRDRIDAAWYGLLAVAVLIVPALMSDYYVGEATWVFIYAIGGVSLMALVGYTGLVSLGHAAFLVLVLWLTRNLLRSPTGRAWIAIRDSEIAAQSMGVNLAIYKSIAFAYSAALMGLAGALFAHKIAYLAPDIFTILLSIQFLLLSIVGGLGSLHGAVFGAIFVALLPPLIAILRDSIPDSMAQFATSTGITPIGSLGSAIGAFLAKPGVEAGIFGLILVLVILLAPLGMYGRLVKIRIFFSTFP